MGRVQYLGGDIKNTLISSLKDVLVEITARQVDNSVDQLLARLYKARYSVLTRIALHTTSVAPDKLLHHLNKFAKRKTNLDNPRIMHELFSLLKDNFGKLEKEAKTFIVNWIDAGPDINRFVAWQLQLKKDTPGDQEKLDYVNTWKLERLWKLRDYLPERKKQIDILSRRYATPKDVESNLSGMPTYGYRSSVTVDQLLREDNEAILARLYKPERGDDPISPYLGLALTFGEAVKKERDRFLQLAGKMADPVIMPLLIQHYVRGLHEAWKAEYFEWSPDLMKLATFIVKGFEEILTYPSLAYGQAKRELADFIQTVVQDRTRPVTSEQMRVYRDLLIQIASDADPTPDSKRESKDWSFLSLNSTSGTGLHGLIKYALRYAHERKGEKPRLEEEVKAKLLETLQFDQRPSNRCVLGMYLANLWYLDDEWVRSNLPLFFPPKNDLMRKAVWDAYVSFNNVYTEIVNEIRPQYLNALKELRGQREHRDSRDKLAQHVAIIYWRGLDEIDEESSLVRQFFEIASIPYRRRFIWQIERGLQELREKDQLKVDGKEWQRPRALWNWRTSAVRTSRTTKKGLDESSAFLQWLPYVPEDINSLYDLVEATLLRRVPTSHVGDVTKYLAKQSEKFPIESARLLRVYFRIPLDRHHYYFDDKEVRLVLERALESVDEGKSIASDIANKLGEYGRFDYKYIWDQANAAKEVAPG